MAMIILVFVALLADLLSIIPGVGIAVGPAFWFCVAWYFYYKGFGLLNARRLAPMVVSGLAEILPIVQSLPTIVVGMIILLAFLKVQEKTGISLKDATHGKFTKQPTFNAGGVRQPSQPQPSAPSRSSIQPLVSDGVRAPQDYEEAA